MKTAENISHSNPNLLNNEGWTKHEVIPCERCNIAFECKANNYSQCQCNTVQLTINEMQYVSELYDGCLCANCLKELQEEYREALGG